jgi:imidazolonepropionase-like amidohydrolase
LSGSIARCTVGPVLRLTGGLVYDAQRGESAPATLVVEGDRIAEVVPAEAPPRPGDDRLDVSGQYLLPGLIDCHVHLVMRGEDADPSVNARRSDEEIAASGADAAERTLLGGITTVRDVGGWNYLEMSLRREIEDGRRRGPRLFLAGRLLSLPTPAVEYYPGMYEVASGLRGVGAAARRQLARGADLIKVMATGSILSPQEEDAEAVQFSPSELRAAVEAAAEAGAVVAAHAHARDGIENATRAGVASIEHGTFADDSVLELMAASGTFLVPTMAATLSSLRDPRVMAAMAPHVRERFVSTAPTHLEMVRRAHALGVPIAMGTDAGTPGNHHGDNAMECVYLVEEAGLSPREAIMAATANAARLLGQEGNLGSLQPGRLADVVGVRGDPIRDIRALLDVAFVMKSGSPVH